MSPATTARAGDVHVWTARMDAFPADLEPMVATLPADEQATAARIRAPGRLRHFVLGRVVLRTLLGDYLDRAAATLPFRYLDDGKPVLDDADAGLHFNIAHSGDLILVGLSRTEPLGVDIEQLRPVPQLDAIARTWFTDRERAWLEARPDADRAEAFLLLWTCREALTKAGGQGISRAWRDFEIAMGDAGAAVAAPTSPRWSLFHPPVADGYVATIAMTGEAPAVQDFDWTAGKTR
jgi:4'-phosphopantetheinyl transferase